MIHRAPDHATTARTDGAADLIASVGMARGAASRASHARVVHARRNAAGVAIPVRIVEPRAGTVLARARGTWSANRQIIT